MLRNVLLSVMLVFAAFVASAAPSESATSPFVAVAIDGQAYAVANVDAGLPSGPRAAAHQLALMPDDGGACFHCGRGVACDESGYCYYPPALASTARGSHVLYKYESWPRPSFRFWPASAALPGHPLSRCAGRPISR